MCLLQKKFHFINLNPSGCTVTKHCLEKRKLLQECCLGELGYSSAGVRRPKRSLLRRHLPRCVARVSQREEKTLLQCPIYALCQSLGNNSCCHQPLIFLVFDTIHGDKFGDRSLQSNPEPWHGPGMPRCHVELCDQPSAEMENKIPTFPMAEISFSNNKTDPFAHLYQRICYTARAAISEGKGCLTKIVVRVKVRKI